MDAPRSVITQLITGDDRRDRGTQRRFTLTVPGAAPRAFAAEVVTIGSSSRNDVVIDDPTVSRHHARIELRGGELVICDLGSTNGTTVDGVRIEGIPLDDRQQWVLTTHGSQVPYEQCHLVASIQGHPQ